VLAGQGDKIRPLTAAPARAVPVAPHHGGLQRRRPRGRGRPFPDNNDLAVWLVGATDVSRPGALRGRDATWLAAADQRRRLTDLATANTSSFARGDVSVLLNRGTARSTTRARPSRRALLRAAKTVAADFDGDGVPDPATSNFLTNDVAVLFGRPDGTFTGPARYPVGRASHPPRRGRPERRWP
jgi:hypothetical protein